MNRLRITNRGVAVVLTICVGFTIACGMTGIHQFDTFVWMP